MDLLDDDLDVLEIIEYGFPRRVNIRKNYFEEMDDLTFFQSFRLYKVTFLHILALIEENLEFVDDRNNSVSPCNQLLCALRFYASSGHLRSVALFMGMHTSTACRIVAKVSHQIAMLYPVYIKMPTEQTVIAEQEKFFDMYNFPRVIGVVDGTHIKLQSPGGNDGEVFRNRKGFFSFNVQVIANADLKFIDVVARWPGSAHDSTIFANSRVKARMDAGEYPNSVLLGDSGYPLREYFLTPIENPGNEAEEVYNRFFLRTRNSIERAIGLWKRRFPVVAYGMRVQSDNAMAIIIATAILHNVAREMNEPEPPPPHEIDIEQLNYLIQTQNIDVAAPDQEQAVNFTRREFINFFNNLQ